MNLYFTRHGETEWNVKKKIQGTTDTSLNENGIRQAKLLAQTLLNKRESGAFHPVRVYNSPYLRAAQTAQIVADALDIPCETMDGLREMDLGEWEGLNWDIIRAEYGERYLFWNSHRRFVHTPGGENYDEVLGRTLAALDEILARETEDVLIVTHSAVLMALRCYLAGLPFEEMVRCFRTKNTELVMLEETEIRQAVRRYKAGE